MFTIRLMRVAAVFVSMLSSGWGCGGDSPTGSPPDNSPSPGGLQLPAVYQKITGAQVRLAGDTVVITTTNVPSHKSTYFVSTDARWESYSPPGFSPNPTRITVQSITFRIPLHPAQASPKINNPQRITVIGVAVNGVVLMNQYRNETGGSLDAEFATFDQCNGHPGVTGVYHYHIEPICVTAANASALLGFMLDGFPIYGPVEAGKRLESTDLDGSHGHFGATPDYTGGTYHYHVTTGLPYLLGATYYGKPGSIAGI